MTSKRICIVDDEQDNLEFLQEILADTGCETCMHSDGAAALAAMREAPPSMAILDIQMPGMNGFQVLQAMREDAALARVPVVFLSAIGAVTGDDYSPEIIEQKYGVRPDAFIPKPIDPAAVQAAVDAAMAKTGN